MKTFINFITIISFLIISETGLNAQTIHSTTTGGYWNQTTTWQEGVIPSAADDVIITASSTVYVDINDAECLNITVEPGATLRNRQNQYRTLFVYGNITNNGTVTDPNYTLTLNIYGNITNNGDWSNQFTNLVGTGTHTIAQANGMKFSGANFNLADTTGQVTALSDITFEETDVNLNGREIIISEGKKFSVLGIYTNTVEIKNGTISGSNYDYEGNDYAKLSDIKFTGNVTLFGTVRFYGTVNVFEGEVINNAFMRNNKSNYATITINGNITNNDTITDPNYELNLNITGNITNNGVWSNHETNLTGSGTHTISQGPGNMFSGEDFNAADTTGQITALSDITFNVTDVDLNGVTLIMAEGKRLTVMGASGSGNTVIFSDGIVSGGNYEFEGNIYSKLSDMKFTGNVTLEGTVQFIGVADVFEGEVINNAFLRNYHYNYATLTIIGNITNNDTITDPDYSFTLNITGNIVNNGVWSNQETNLTGSGTHTISQGPGNMFSGEDFNAADTTGQITALSDIIFNVTDVDLNGVMLVMAEGKRLTVVGASGNGNTVIFTDGIVSGSNYEFEGNVYSRLSDMKFTGNVTLEGTVQLLGVANVFEGEVINNAFLRNNHANYATATIDGSITNNDTITDPDYTFTLNITGNIVNNGEWSNHYTNLTGTGTHTISQGAGNKFSGEDFNAADTTGQITALSDITFDVTDVDLNGVTLIMAEGKRLAVLGASGNGNTVNFTDGIVSGGNYEFEGNGYSSFSELTFSGNVALYGNVRALGNNITFSGDVDVRDTLSTRTTTNSTVTIEGRIINNGAIINSNYNLTLHCKGHIINNGVWINYKTMLTGTGDQLIYLVSQKQIEGDVIFDAVTGTTPYQWYWEDTVLNSPDFSGETSQYLEWQVPVSNTWKGDFYCVSASDTSRKIILRSGIIVDPKVFLQGPYNGTDMNTDLADLGLIPLEQPFNTAPWNYDGDEVAPSIPDNVVDWVLVELRQTAGGPETATGGTIVMRRALLLRNDGVAIDPYKFTPELKYDIDVTDNIYLVIWHRNHLGVMSAVSINGLSPARYDFTTAASQAYGGTDALIDLGNGVFGMMGGDADYSQTISGQDINGFWEPNAGTRVNYVTYDFTLDGQIDNKDKNETWAKTVGAATQVP